MIEPSWPRARPRMHRWAGATGVGIAVALLVSGCAPDARGAAIESGAQELAGVKERVIREMPNLPPAGFVDFIDAGGLKIGSSVIGQDSIPFAGASESFVTAATERDGVGAVEAVVTGVGNAGSGDLYDDAIVYACFEVKIDIAKRSVLEYRDLKCPLIVTSGMAGYEVVKLSEIS